MHGTKLLGGRMITSGKFSINFYSGLFFKNRRKIIAIVFASLLILMFQNCGGPSSGAGAGTQASTDPNTGSATGATTPTTDGGTTGTTTPPTTGGGTTPTPTTPTISVTEQRANCYSAIKAPTISGITSGGVAASAATISSGLGNGSGNVSSAAYSMSIDRGIVKSDIYAANNCDTHLNLSLNCQVLATNPNSPAETPLAVSQAINPSGDSVLPFMSSMAIVTAAHNTCNNTTLPVGANTLNFNISPNIGNVRCVEGNFWIKMIVRSAISTITGVLDSTPSYFKVTIKNGCWKESRLKDSQGPLPGVVNFGTAVAISGAWAAVLAPTDDASANVLDVGSVYMYMFDGSNWVQKQKIMIAAAPAGKSLGSIALHGDTLIIGSPYLNDIGAVYFFRRNVETWTQIQQVDPQPNSNIGQRFGHAVALNAGYVLVGSPNYNSSNTLVKAGAVSVYSYNTSGMTYIKTLTGAVANAAFGSALAVHNNIWAVGAPQALGKESLAPGSVFIYDEAAGAFNLSATKTGTVAAEKFGASLAVYGKRVAVGSPNLAKGATAGFGRVTYYDDYTVVAATKTIDGGAATDNLGQGLALSSTGLYIGVPYTNTRAGQVNHYLYADIVAGRNYYTNLAYNQSGNSAFGYAVATSGSDVIIGARIKSDPNDNSGAAYIYRYK